MKPPLCSTRWGGVWQPGAGLLWESTTLGSDSRSDPGALWGPHCQHQEGLWQRGGTTPGQRHLWEHAEGSRWCGGGIHRWVLWACLIMWLSSGADLKNSCHKIRLRPKWDWWNFSRRRSVANRANINSKHRALIALIIVTSHFLLSWIHSTISHLLTWSYTAAGHQGTHTSLSSA